MVWCSIVENISSLPLLCPTELWFYTSGLFHFKKDHTDYSILDKSWWTLQCKSTFMEEVLRRSLCTTAPIPTLSTSLRHTVTLGRRQCRRQCRTARTRQTGPATAPGRWRQRRGVPWRRNRRTTSLETSSRRTLLVLCGPGAVERFRVRQVAQNMAAGAPGGVALATRLSVGTVCVARGAGRPPGATP